MRTAILSVLLCAAALGQTVNVKRLKCGSNTVAIPVSINNQMYCLVLDGSLIITMPTATAPGVIAVNNLLPSGIIWAYFGPAPLPACTAGTGGIGSTGVLSLGPGALAYQQGVAGTSGDTVFVCMLGVAGTPEWVQFATAP
jgi:hypothetical protein